jgi:hypothetical protein
MAEQNFIKHAHAKSSRIAIRMRVEEMKKVLVVVETDLALNDLTRPTIITP